MICFGRNNQINELNYRIKLAWEAFRKLNYTFKSDIPLNLKKIFLISWGQDKRFTEIGIQKAATTATASEWRHQRTGTEEKE